MGLLDRLRIADCLVCRKRAWGTRHGVDVDADFARRLLKLLGSPEAETDIPSVPLYGTRKWLVHSACWDAHAEQMQLVLRERYAEDRQRAVAEAAAEQARPPSRLDRMAVAAGVEITAGMSKQDVVRLLGEPVSGTSLRDYLAAQHSVRSLGGRPGNVAFWFFDVLPAPGRVLRIAFGGGRVLGIKEVDWPG
ncbi:hypothetical protein [Plantactinospora sp. CA-290183]|uniref:hypothetical protein n=1 Tax=Plantactinospora sp. CA-290183 TaxID=3240006 RepID=UPI003D9219F2